MGQKKIAITQSNYIPWKGYFDMISYVDEFILYDDVQYTRRDWRNRNLIKTAHGVKWLTIPVSAGYTDIIRSVKVADPDWNQRHWKTIYHAYRQAAGYDFWAEEIEALYLSANQKRLSEINYHFLHGINNMLGINTPLNSSSDFELAGGKSERLLSICRQAEADVYVSGPAAKGYLEVALFEKEGITVEWMSYEDYSAYPQLFGEFNHYVSVIDLMLNTGKKARSYLKNT